jgi:hypothetical protein
LIKRLAKKKTSTTTARNRFITEGRTGETEKAVVRRCTVYKFSRSSSGFNPGLGEAEDIWTVRIGNA